MGRRTHRSWGRDSVVHRRLLERTSHECTGSGIAIQRWRWLVSDDRGRRWSFGRAICSVSSAITGCRSSPTKTKYLHGCDPGLILKRSGIGNQPRYMVSARETDHRSQRLILSLHICRLQDSEDLLKILLEGAIVVNSDPLSCSALSRGGAKAPGASVRY